MIRKRLYRSAIVVGLLSATLISCKKTIEILPKEKITVSEKLPVDISILKTFMSGLVNVKVTDIKYSEETQIFSMFGENQIDREHLTQFYNESLKK